jgi:putative flippase GtrA
MKNSSQKVRFVAVGGINTLIDFGLLFTLKALGLPAVSANIISTTTAFCFSFFANKKYTFKTAGTDIKREIILFIIITLFGLWVLQTLIIAFVTNLLASTQLSDSIILLVAKLFATIVSLIWNYTLYSRVIFKQQKPPIDTV